MGRFKLCFLVLMIFFTSTCTNTSESESFKKDKSSNDFLAYYNTFYTADLSFNKAVDLIDSEYNSSENNPPPEALNLLDLSIKNSYIILENFYNTQYVDDASYILARSSIYKNKLSVASYYLDKIINDFPNSTFIYESYIWKGFIQLKLGNYSNLNKTIIFLEKNIDSLDSSLYLYYELLAKKSLNESKDTENEELQIKNLEEAKKYFIFAIQNINNNLKKRSIYMKLLEISEYQNKYDDALIYIYELSASSEEGLSSELLDKWFEYNRLVLNYESIYSEIDGLINNNQLTTKQRIYYLIQKVRTFIHDADFEDAHNIIDDILNEIEDNKSYKIELSEIYYLKGKIYLDYESQYNLAREFFEKSINSTTSQTNIYKVKSELLMDAIIKYTSIEQEFIYLKDNIEDYVENNYDDIDDENNTFYIPFPNDYNKTNDISDSLLYTLGQILYFDLDKKDSAIVKFKQVISKYPESELSFKSMFALSLFDNESNWLDTLKKYNPNSIYLGFDDKTQNNILDSLRNIAWNKFDISFDDAINEFKYIYETHDDPISCYIVAFIYDHYKMDLKSAAEYYAKTIEYQDLLDLISPIETEDLNNVNNKVMDGEARLNQIADLLDKEIEKISHKQLYSRAIRYLDNQDFNIDSLLFYLDSIENGASKNINQKVGALIVSGNNYNRFITTYMAHDSLKLNDSLSVNYKVDSLLYNLSKLSLDDFGNLDYASKYCYEIINNYPESIYLTDTYSILNYIEPNKSWDSLIYKQAFDSTKIIDLINYDYLDIGKNIINFNIEELNNELIRYNEYKTFVNQYFINSDTINIQIDTIKLNTKD